MNLYKVYVNNGRSHESYDMDCFIILAATKEEAEFIATKLYYMENNLIKTKCKEFNPLITAIANKIFKTDNGYDIFCTPRLKED